MLIYNRVSSYGKQAGRDQTKLEMKTEQVRDVARVMAPGRLIRAPFDGVELGKLSARRPALRKVLDYAAAECSRRPLLVVARDLSRFLRSEAYHHKENPEAWPTADEFERLRAMVPNGVILCTILDPHATEAERHRYVMAWAEGCGRPRQVDPKKAQLILEYLGSPSLDDTGNTVWGDRSGRREDWTSISKAAGVFGVSKAAVQRLVEGKVPAELCEGQPDVRWKDLRDPANTYRKARRLGYV